MSNKNDQTIDQICAEIQRVQRAKVAFLKSRIMIENRLVATVAVSALDYAANLSEEDRKARFDKAREIIAEVRAGKSDVCKDLIEATTISLDAFTKQVEGLDKELTAFAKCLPVAVWINGGNCKGFGLLSLATVIGETGNLSNYANPAKVWRRLGLAPFQSGGKVQMGSTWRMKGGLTSKEWEEYGYSPRRRSVVFVIGENIIKQNGDGPYRKRYDTVKAESAIKHPEWTSHATCKGEGKTSTGRKCAGCKGTGKVMLRCHRHAMLLATKMLIRDLWCAWQ